MNSAVVSQISFIFNGKFAYIYLWFSPREKVLYVGQTNAAGGVYARGCQHLGRFGTLRDRFHDVIGDKLECTDDWVLISYKLPAQKKYTSIESSYRLAVEYLVQIKLHEIRGQFTRPFKIISNVTYNDYCRNKEVDDLSKKIIDLFSLEYENKSLQV